MTEAYEIVGVAITRESEDYPFEVTGFNRLADDEAEVRAIRLAVEQMGKDKFMDLAIERTRRAVLTVFACLEDTAC